MASVYLPLRGALTLAALGYSANALAVDCFIDTVGGNDSNTGLSEDQAVKSQAKIPKSCTVAKYKRGSQFAEKLAVGGSVKTFTNYGDPCQPLPKFVMPGTTNTGPVVSSFQGGITIDGLYLANSHGDGSSSGSNFSQGVCVNVGGNSVVQHCEITSCDIGVMIMGTGSKFLNNYVHDLNTMIADAPQSSGININVVGGAEGIFVNGSNNEIAYNQFINCTGASQWTGGQCDGGATEVSIGNNATLSGVKIHHNFAYNTCGFFEVSSGTAGGTFADSEFYNNVAVDSGWMFLFQVNNTTIKNIRWENNTIIYHKSGTTTSYAPTVSMIYNGTGTAGAGNAKVGTVPPDSTYFTNNLVLYDGFSAAGTVDSNIVQANNLITTKTTGVVKNIGVGGTMPSPSDFDLVSGSLAIDGAVPIGAVTADFLNRTVPAGGAPDIGAFEFDATLAAGQATPVATMDVVTGKAGECQSPGGETNLSSGSGPGSSSGAGGTATTKSTGTGGGGGTAQTSPTAKGMGGTKTPASSAPAGSSAGEPENTRNGEEAGTQSKTDTSGSGTASSGAAGTASGSSSASGASAGSSNSGQTGSAAAAHAGAGGASEPVDGANGTANRPAAAEGCGCRVAGQPSASAAMGMFGLLAATLIGRRRRTNPLGG